MSKEILPDVLPKDVTRCIYLDCDTIVNLDIRTLWEEKTGPNGLGAVAENESCDGPSEYEKIIRDVYKRGIFRNDIRIENMVPFINYFNSGILLMDLDVIRHRDKSMAECTMDFISSFPDSSYPEQDALNIIFSEDYNRLNERYNTFIDQEIFVKKRIFYAPSDNRMQLKEIIHLNDEETYIENDNINSPDTLFDIMDKEDENSCLVIIDYDYTNLRRLLLEKGFTEFKDFVNGRVFLLA